MNTNEYILYYFFTWTCIATSVFLKIPQLIAVVKSKSAKGLSTVSTFFELWAYSATVSYQFAAGIPVMQYVDYFPLMLQEFPLVFLVVYYNRDVNWKTAIFGAVYCTVFGSVISGASSTTFNLILIVRLNSPFNT